MERLFSVCSVSVCHLSYVGVWLWVSCDLCNRAVPVFCYGRLDCLGVCVGDVSVRVCGGMWCVLGRIEQIFWLGVHGTIGYEGVWCGMCVECMWYLGCDCVCMWTWCVCS